MKRQRSEPSPADHVTFSIPGRPSLTANPVAVAAIDLDDMINELAGHSSRYAFWAFALADVKVALHDIERRMSRTRSRLSRELRGGARVDLRRGASSRRATEKEVTNLIEEDVEYSRQCDEADRLRALEHRLTAIRDALMHRRYCLTSLAILRAPELSAGPATRAARYVPKV